MVECCSFHPCLVVRLGAWPLEHEPSLFAVTCVLLASLRDLLLFARLRTGSVARGYSPAASTPDELDDDDDDDDDDDGDDDDDDDDGVCVCLCVSVCVCVCVCLCVCVCVCAVSYTHLTLPTKRIV